MLSKYRSHLFLLIMVLIFCMTISVFTVYAGEVSLQDGKIKVTDTLNSITGTAPVTVTASGGYFSQKTNTITITNNSGSTANLSFSWVASNFSSFTDPNGASATSGTYSAPLANGGSVSLSIKGKKAWSSNTATLSLSDFSLSTASTSTITFEYDSNLGSISVGGKSVAPNEDVTLSSETELTATPTNGATFFGWIIDGVRQESATITLVPDKNKTVTAVFIGSGSPAWFIADGKYYNDLNDANTVASEASNKNIILACSGTLPPGNYTISSGVTLLIPYDTAGTVITNNMKDYLLASNDQKVLFRQLTMVSGSTITVDGSLCVGSKTHRQMTGRAGPYGAISMESDSNITINGEATLYAWGYISGAGTITMKGTVYEHLSVTDYPGSASTTIGIYNEDGSTTLPQGGGAFPMRAFSICNIEVPVIYSYGAVENVFYSLYGSNFLVGERNGYIELIGKSDSSFVNLASGTTAEKKYASGRQNLTINGSASMNSLEVTVQAGVTMSTSNTSGIPIPSNFDITIAKGTVTLADNIIMTKGSTMTIAHGATVDTNKNSVYVLDSTEDTFPGSSVDATVDVNGTIISSGGAYTSTSGAAIISSQGTGKIIHTGTSSDTTVFVKNANSTKHSIAVTSAQLKNADGSYKRSADNTSYVFVATDNKWHTEACGGKYTDTVTNPTCTEQGYTTHTCACGYSYTDTPVAATGNHTYGMDCLCTMCGRAGIRYNSYYLDLQGQIYLTFTFTVEPGVDITDVYVHVTEEANKIDAQDSWYMLLSSVSKDDKGRYVISQGIAAGAMTGNVTVQFQIGSDPNAAPLTFFDGNSETGTSVVKTVKDYLQTAITSAQSSDTLKALCQAAAQFGGYAQKFYQTHLDDVVSSILGDYSKMPTADDFKNFLTKTDGSIDGVAATGQQVNLDSAVFLRVYFNVADPSAITSIQAGLNMDGVTLDEVELKTDDSGRYYVDVENIPVACWNDEYIISINNGVYTVTTSVMAWARSCIYLSNDTDQRLMAAAMYTFAKAADEYFYS